MPGSPLPLASAEPGKRPFLEESKESFGSWLSTRGEAPMRFRQIRRQLLANRAESFDAMTDLSKKLRIDLETDFTPWSTTVDKHLIASDGTHKLLLKLSDGRRIECVLIQDAGRATACISTQVGCGMGCVFCASGLNGVERNLTTGEIVEQLVRLRNLTQREPFAATGRSPASRELEQFDPDRATRLTHIVVMGMGEPLANLDRLLEALAIAGDKESLHIGARHITISTVGLPAKIRQLAMSGKQYSLAVSLHAPNDELRTKIVPTNSNVGIRAILAAADEFYKITGRQVTYEYVVLGKLNDQPEHARQLVGLLRNKKAHVNLIPWNDVAGLQFRRPLDSDLDGLIGTLEAAGISVKVRKRKGAEIDAACGQLRREAEATGILNAETAQKAEEMISNG